MEYYNLLDLSIDATTDEIRKAYFEAAKIYHPDVNPSSREQEKFIQIQKAYDVLVDPKKRQDYDLNVPKDLLDRKSVQINAYYSRSAIPLISGKQLFYLLLDIFPTKELDSDLLPPVNICLVIDKSTSMQGELLNKIKLETINMVKLLRPKDKISVVAFSDFSEIVIPLTNVSDIGNQISKLQSLQAAGATEIYKGLLEGYQTLNNDDDNNAVKQLILITDGHTYGDEEDCIALIEEATKKGISFQAIGIGTAWNDQFLDELTKISGGETLFVSDAKEMYNSLINKLKNAGILYAVGVKIEFLTDPRINLEYAFRLSPDLSQLNLNTSIQLGNLYIGKHLRVIFEFKINELEESTSELRMTFGTVKFNIPSNKIKKTRLFFDFRKPVVAKISREIPPSIIIDALSKLTLYRIQEKASIEVQAGDIANATKHLHHVATHLLAKGDRNLAHTVLEEAENLQTQKNFSEMGKKKIKYGTRSLLMLPEPENH
jgi:Ca-activated chloride channel family protein